MKTRIAIDPGLSGGIAWRCGGGIVQASAMPDAMTGQVDLLRHLSTSAIDVHAIRENVGSYMPGNSGPGAVTFAGHCHGLDYALYALGIPTVKPVAPQTWQKWGGWSVAKHLPAGYKALPERTKEERSAKAKVHAAAARAHKNEIREAMQRLYPHLKVTLATADALAILTWWEAKETEAQP